MGPTAGRKSSYRMPFENTCRDRLNDLDAAADPVLFEDRRELRMRAHERCVRSRSCSPSLAPYRLANSSRSSRLFRPTCRSSATASASVSSSFITRAPARSASTCASAICLTTSSGRAIFPIFANVVRSCCRCAVHARTRRGQHPPALTALVVRYQVVRETNGQGLEKYCLAALRDRLNGYGLSPLGPGVGVSNRNAQIRSCVDFSATVVSIVYIRGSFPTPKDAEAFTHANNRSLNTSLVRAAPTL